MTSADHIARRVASHEHAEATHLRAADAHDTAERQAREAGDDDRAEHEHELAAKERRGAAIERDRARRAADEPSGS